MKPRIGVLQFSASCAEGHQHSLACGITYEVARRLTSIGGVEANAILLGNGSMVESAASDSFSEASFSLEKGSSVPSLGAEYESDYIVLGKAQVSDGLLLYYRVYEVESGRQIHGGCVSGLRTGVFRLVDELARLVWQAIGLPNEEEEDVEPNPVLDRVSFDAFVDYCRGRDEENAPRSLELFERALEREPTFRMALVEYISLCYQLDDPHDSLELIDRYLDRCADDHEILITAANLCLAFHRLGEGLGYANQALVLRPSDVEPRVLLARFLFAKEMSAEGRSHLEAAMRSPDTSPEGYYCLGRYFLDLGDYYRSREYFEKCLDVEPGYYVAIRDLQCCYYELGDFPQGIAACERLLEVDPSDPGSYYNLGLIYQRLGRARLATKFFEEAVRQDPTFYKAVYMIAEFHYSQGSYRDALEHFTRAHRISPENSDTLGRLGDTHYQLGESREATRYYKMARRQDPIYESARLHFIEATNFAASGELSAARFQLLKAAELDDSLVEVWNELGGVLLRLGKADEAVNVMRRAIEMDSRNAALLTNLLTACRRLPWGIRLAGWARKLERETKQALLDLRSLGVVPSEALRRRYRRRFSTWSWYTYR